MSVAITAGVRNHSDMRGNDGLHFQGIGSCRLPIIYANAAEIIPIIVHCGDFLVNLTWVAMLTIRCHDGVALLHESEIFWRDLVPSTRKWVFEGGRWEIELHKPFVVGGDGRDSFIARVHYLFAVSVLYLHDAGW